MRVLTEKDIQDAFKIWQRNYKFRALDESSQPFDSERDFSWLENARKAMFKSTSTAAKNLEISRSGYCSLEESERKGTITLFSLAKAAAAMNCELVYLLRPNNKLSFSQNIWNQIFPAAAKHPWMNACDPKKKEKALAAIATRFMNDPEFRRNQGWARRSYEI